MGPASTTFPLGLVSKGIKVVLVGLFYFYDPKPQLSVTVPMETNCPLIESANTYLYQPSPKQFNLPFLSPQNKIQKVSTSKQPRLNWLTPLKSQGTINEIRSTKKKEILSFLILSSG